MSRALDGLRIAAVIAFTALVMAAVVSFAARNSSGTYSIVNGPYVPGTTINSAAVNAELADLGNEISSSLDRSGRGGMLASLRGVDGTVAAPAFSFTSEPATGFYKIGASDLGLALGGVKTHEWTATGETVTGTLGVSGAATLSSTLALSDALSVSKSGTAAVSLATLFEPSLATGNAANIILGASNTANGAALVEYTGNATAALSTGCLYVAGASGSTLCVNGNAKTTVAGSGGLQIGGTGTAISGSFRGIAAFSPGTIGANACGTTSVTVTGAVQGSECIVGLPGGAGTLMTACEITATNTCVVAYCNTTGVGITPATGNVACRAFNP